jgi:hypothetical protein
VGSSAKIRNATQRKMDVLGRLRRERDIWVVSADREGTPHAVPFSLFWDELHVVCTTTKSSITARNVTASGKCRVIDAAVKLAPVDESSAVLGGRFKQRNGWDPRDAKGEWTYLIMQPYRIQAWKSEDELSGRTIMRDGTWLT